MLTNLSSSRFVIAAYKTLFYYTFFSLLALFLPAEYIRGDVKSFLLRIRILLLCRAHFDFVAKFCDFASFCISFCGVD